MTTAFPRGRTRTNKKAFFHSDRDERGCIITVKITDAKVNPLTGSPEL